MAFASDACCTKQLCARQISLNFEMAWFTLWVKIFQNIFYPNFALSPSMQLGLINGDFTVD